jgi:CelD/BcsL family acetyltransferase involved in cellulose biosynthesis
MGETTATVVRWQEFMPGGAAEWRALWERTGAPPDLSPMWAESLVVSHAVALDSIRVVVSRQEGELVLVWPFRTKVRNGPHPPLRQLAPLQNVHCLHAGVLATLGEGEAILRILGALRAARARWQWLRIDQLHVGSPLHAAWLSGARSTGSPVSWKYDRRSPYIAHDGTIEELLARRSPRFRKTTRGLLRTLEKGGARIRVMTRPDELAEFRALVHDIEARSWKHSTRTSIASRPWETVFYDEILSRFGPGGCLVAAILEIDGAPAAHSLDVRRGPVVYGLKTSFDTAFAEHRPGMLLLAGLLASYFASGVREYDLLGEAEPYKMQWTDTTRDQVTLRVWGASPLGRALHRVEKLYRRIRRG